MPLLPFSDASPPTTNASLLTSGTLEDARLSSNVALDNQNNSFTAGQSITATANTSALTATYSVTGANTTPLLDLSGTWNTTGVAGGILLNITDTASNSGSLLCDLRVGGTSKFTVNKLGYAFVAASTSATVNCLQLGSSNTGFSDASSQLTVNNQGSACAAFVSGSIKCTSYGLTSSIGSGADVILNRDAASTLALRNGGTAASPVPQNLRVYNWYTDASNLVRSGLRFASNVAELYAEAVGTGVQPQLGINLGTTSATSGSVPLNITQTWNAGAGVTQTALKLNVTDSASAATSLLMDLQVNGTSRFSIGSQSNGILTYSSASTDCTGIRLTNTSSSGKTYAFISTGQLHAASSGVFGLFNLSDSKYVYVCSPDAFGINVSSFYGFMATSYGPNPSGYDVRIYRDAANILALRNGTNANTLRVYGSFTDSSNGRRLDITSTTAGIFTLTATGNGTGATGNLLKLTQPILLPASSVSLATNGDLAFEATSNTTLTIRYRGSDGTTRSAAITLA